MKNILVIGSGGREHAFVKTLKKSKNIGKIYALPSNAGISEDAIGVANIKQSDFVSIENFCKEFSIDYVLVGPEQPLVDGIVDYLSARNIKVFGADKSGARLEGSKDFMKFIATKYNVPTAEYQTFDDKEKALEFVRNKGVPIVIKADGLAAGKGVCVAMNLREAEAAISDAFAGKFGSAGNKLVIEEFLEGEEASFFVVTDGKTALEFGFAQDHKRAFDGDKGPNTGGMGTYSPAPIVTDSVKEKIFNQIIYPTLKGLQAEGIIYKGFLFAGLMIDNLGNPKLIEYNIRMGDPETQVILPRLKTDLLEIIEAVCDGNLAEIGKIEFENNHALCVVMAANGYPEVYEKNCPIDLSDAKNLSDVTIFHAGTALDENGNLISIGGRVLGVTALGDNISDAQKKAYEAVKKIKFQKGFYRKDIGFRAVNK
ncbi:MAG: phosphoribosylamine--glycine ligase [Rickettsiales bacterium]|nr:phosphoribosylamine--glycine ligase [Rickettsiales bacterium]